MGRVLPLMIGSLLLPLGCGGPTGPALATVEVTTTSLPDGVQNAPYSEALTATGGDGNYTWSVTVGSLPPGLSLNMSTGEIAGTPTVVETENFTVRVASGDGQTTQQALSITVTIVFAASGLSTGFPPSDLYGVQALVTGTDFLIGRLRTPSGFEPVITDLALAPDGSLWGISFGKLYRLDKTTATATEVGRLGVSDANALAFDETGILFGATVSGSLIRINPATAQADLVGPYGANFQSSGDIAFAPDGRLLGTAGNISGKFLVLIDRTTGAATPVNPGTPIGFDDPWGLAFVGNELFALTTDRVLGSGQLLKIDTTIGTGTFVRDLSFNAFGAGVPLKTEEHESLESGST